MGRRSPSPFSGAILLEGSELTGPIYWRLREENVVGAATIISMTVAILDYDAGNVTSVAHAVRRLGFDAEITADHDVIRSADHVIFPGVGAAATCMKVVRERGLDVALHEAVESGKPVFGICVGMQLLFDHSEEDGGVDCLGLLPGRVRRFELDDPSLKVPHMGWNPVSFVDNEPIAAGLDVDDPAFYFVHSYYCDPDPSVDVIATTDHGHPFCVGVRKDNLVALQCHPEKSGPVGVSILSSFLEGA